LEKFLTSLIRPGGLGLACWSAGVWDSLVLEEAIWLELFHAVLTGEELCKSGQLWIISKGLLPSQLVLGGEELE
jgi:hypothetical protein